LKFKEEISSIRTGRPHTGLVEDIKVNYYDQTMPLKQIGSIGVVPPRTIQIQVWDKGSVDAVVKAVESSALNLSASADGNIIRINLPELSEERREEIIKHVKKIAEEHRIHLRNLRDEVNKKIQASLDAREISEDQKFKLREDVQSRVDKINESIEQALENKIQEIKA